MAKRLLDGKEIIVVDRSLRPREMTEVTRILQATRYSRVGMDDPKKGRYRTFVSGFSAENAREFPWFRRIIETVLAKFPSERLSLKQVMCNSLVYGDMLFPHRDSFARPTGREITAVYFANPKWERSWGGETVFFDRAGEAQIAVSPKPGRLILFRSAIEHRAGVPLRECYEQRLTLSMKFSVAAATRR